MGIGRHVNLLYSVCSEIYPYVVITMGLENILIIVKAVMSTPEELDVREMSMYHVMYDLVCVGIMHLEHKK